MRRRIPVLALATAAVIGVTYLRWSPNAAPSVTSELEGARPNDAALAQAAKVGRAEVTRLIGEYERQVAEQPTAGGLKFLTQLYLQRGRLTGDVATYGQAQTAIERARALAPRDTESAVLSASVLGTTHDFAGAAAAARSVLAEKPEDMGALAVLGDAQLEQGDYDGARATFDKMAASQPDAAAVLVRQAHLAFLTGHVDDARRLAADAKHKAMASAFGDAALGLYSAFQGQIEHDTGNYDKATDFYRRALRESPGYYVALAGLAREQAALDHTTDAITTYADAIAAVPQPETLAALGDLYRVRHDDAHARTEYDTVGVIATLAALNKQVYNRALAVYNADHDVNVEEAVRLTEGELSTRRDVYGYDAYAWALYKSHRYTEARDAASKALSLGTQDARLWYHAGMIDAALGQNAPAADLLARALKLSPKFDPIQAPIARTTLAAVSQQANGATS